MLIMKSGWLLPQIFPFLEHFNEEYQLSSTLTIGSSHSLVKEKLNCVRTIHVHVHVHYNIILHVCLLSTILNATLQLYCSQLQLVCPLQEMISQIGFMESATGSKTTLEETLKNSRVSTVL